MEDKQTAIKRYQQGVYKQCLGMGIFLHAVVPAVLSKQEAAKARREVYAWLRENMPHRFPKGHRFNA
jgi:hypothetical protein